MSGRMPLTPVSERESDSVSMLRLLIIAFIGFIVDADELFYGIFNFVKTTNKRVLFHYFYYERVQSVSVTDTFPKV